MTDYLAFGFNEQFYLQHNPDVAAAVNSGVFASALEHFVQFGANEGRDPNANFDTDYYLAHNPDVAAAIESGMTIDGHLLTAYEHFTRFGFSEGREGEAPVTVEVPGPTVYVPVEVPVEPAHTVTHSVNEWLDPTGHKPGVPNEVNIGGGGNYASNYQIAHDLTANMEIGAKAHVRTGYDYTGVAEADGTVVIRAMAGQQTGGDLDDGWAQVNNNARSHTSVDFSFNFGTTNVADSPLTAKMYFDVDPSEAVQFREFTFDNAGGFWTDDAGIPVIGNDGGRPGSYGHVIQDSINLGFGYISNHIVGGVGPNGAGDIPAGLYDFKLAVIGPTGLEYSSQTIQFDLVDELVPVVNPVGLPVTTAFV